MAEERVQRRLAAILVADVVGYSRMMGADEAGTLERLNAFRHELLHPKVDEYGGRIFKTTGDGTVIEFPSAVYAVQHAIDVQEALRHRNSELPETERLEIRIGINLGDVIVQNGDIYGDGVNIAARLEGLADPGSVVVSSKVHEEVRIKLDIDFEDLGPQELKNIAEPVRAFLIRSLGNTAVNSGASLALPDRPSVAVLPFENMSGDPEQQYFSDGLSEDIITDLSKISGLFVIARNSSFIYRGKPLGVAAVSRKLGVRYVLEGSVRRTANRVRVTAQLIDGTTDGHLWAERYDRDLSDIFAVQDEIVREIVSALKVKLGADGELRSASSTTNNMETYDLFLRARDLVFRQTQEANEQAKPLLERAIALSPDFAPAHAFLAAPLIREYVNGWVENPEESLARGLASAEHAVRLDGSLPQAHWLLGLTLMWMRRLEPAARAVERSIALEPNFADAHAALGQVYIYAGRPAEAIEPLQTAMRLDPHYRDVFLHFLGQAYFMAGQFQVAVDTLKRRLIRRPDTDITRVLLAASYGYLGETDLARAEWAEVLRINPGYSLERRRTVLPFADPADFDKIVDGLRKAGLLE